MFINIQFGYQQSRLFNTNCQVAPLLDAINTACYQDMTKYIKKREDFFNKEIANFRKKEATLLKQLEKLNEKPEEKETARKAEKIKNMTKEEKKKYEAEKARKAEEDKIRKEKEAEEARIKAEEEERKRKEEEEAALKANKGKKPAAKDKKDEPVVEKLVETEEQKKEKEKVEINKQLEELKIQIDQYQAKVNLCAVNMAKVAADAEAKKVIELCERTGERKHIN